MVKNILLQEHQKEINNSTALQLEFETQRVMSEYCNEETVCKVLLEILITQPAICI